MKRMKSLCLVLASAVALGVLQTCAAVVPGEWNTNFASVKEWSEEKHVPMVVFMGATECDHCQTLINTAINTTTFKTWQAERKLAMAFCEGEGDYSDLKTLDVFKWFKANGEGGKVPGIPMIGVCWPKADGTKVTSVFLGRNGEMPVKAGTLVRQLIDSIERTVSAYGRYSGGTFAVPNTEGSHYEAEIGRTTWVDVRLVRETAGVATNNFLVTRINGAESQVKVAWSAAATDAVVRVDLPASLTGDVALKLLDGNGALVTNSAIRAVAPKAASRENPLWLGERTATGENALKAGEWTMDVDTAFARTKAQSGEAWTAAYCAGSLWCPDCHGFATNFLDKAVFMDWAAAHNVALVLVDMPRGTEFGGKPVGTPTLVSYEACNKPGKADDGKSGAAYLSRKMVTFGKAQEIFARNHTLTHETWYRDYDRAPRTGKSGLEVTLIPTLILFDKQGRIVSKLSGSRYLPNATTFTAAEYKRRLDEMLEMANDASHGVEGLNNDWSTTTDAMTAQGSFEGTLSAGDGIPTEETEAHYVVDYVKLTGLAKGVKETLTVCANDGRNAAVKLAIVTVKDGRTTTLGEAAGTLASGVSVTASVSDGNACYARVLGNDPFGVFALSNKTSSVRGYRLTGAVTLVPQVTASSIDLSSGSAKMEVVPETAYRLVASVGSVSATGLSDLGGGVFRAGAQVTEATVSVTPGARLTYQVWKTGTVGFAEALDEIKEATYDQTLDLVFTREDGASGRAELKVNVVGGTAENGIRYEWPTNAAGDCVARSVVWEDGDAADKTLSLKILSDGGYDGDETVVLGATGAAGSVATVGLANMVVTILELEEKASAGKVRFVADQAALVKRNTAYAVEGTELGLSAERTDGADGTVLAKVSCSADAAEATPAVLEWPKRMSGERTTFVQVPLLAEMEGKTSFKVTLTGPQVVSSGKSVTVNVIAADAPRFVETEKRLRLVQYVAANASVQLTGLSGEGVAKVTKLSGSVPTGVKMKLTDGVFEISGTPSKAGEWTSVWQVKEGKEAGGLVKVVCSVAEFSAPIEEGGVGALADLLPAGSKKANYAGLAFGKDGLYGTLSLSLSGKGAMTLACDTPAARKSFTTKGWTSTDGAGRLCLVATARTGETVNLSVSADAEELLTISGAIDDPEREAPVSVYFPTHYPAWSAENPAEEYVGSYTACLRNDSRERTDPAFRAMARGDGYLALTMKASAAKTGRMTWAGMLPNGVTMSGSAILIPYYDGYAERMLLAFVRRNATDGFAALVTVEPPGELVAGVPRNNQLIAPLDEMPGVWSHATRGCAAASFAAKLSVYGGYYGTDLNLAACALNGDGTVRYGVVADVSSIEPDGKLGPVAVGPEGREAVIGTDSVSLVADGSDDSRLKLTFRGSTGVVSGSFRLFGSSGASVTATWRGVLLPGWQSGCPECGSVVLPFLSGGAYFTDKLEFLSDQGSASNVSVKQGLRFSLQGMIE